MQLIAGKAARSVALMATLCAQTISAQQLPPSFRADSTDVLVDVVVRDKKGRMMRGLSRGDVMVNEDGIEQSISSFREVTRPAAEPIAGATPAGAHQEGVQVSATVRLVSLIYDRLGPDGRRLSRQASLDFLRKDLGPNVYYAIFTVDRGFQIVQQYTNDHDRLRRAIEAATAGERSDFNNDLAGLQGAANASSGSEGASAAVSASAQGGTGPGGAVDGAALSNEQAGRMAKEMLDFSEMISREDLGRMSVFSLWAIIKELKKLPGRKTALYFAEGVQMPNGLVEHFKSMISEANLANVSVYAVDARGLTTTGDQSQANARLSEAARWSQYARSTQTESAEGNKQEFRTFDRAVDSLRANQQNVMMELAESTGGLLVANTNDLRPNLQRLSEEFNTYYEITYHPKNQVYDGRFRAIAVTVSRNDAVVQARNGYFALPQMEGQTVFTYEVPLLRTLARTPLPRDVDFRAAVLQYRQQFGMRQAAVVFDLPLKDIRFEKDEKAGKYRTHITVLALVKDAEGRVVAKLSRDVPLNEPLDRLGGFQQGRFIVTRPAYLQPGRYTVESVAADQEGQRVAAKKSVLVVPTAAPAAAEMSDIALVRRLDKPSEVRDPQDPLQIEAGRIVPTLADTVPSGAGNLLSLFFTLYPASSAKGPPALILELIKDGEVVARSKPPLPQADATGAIPYLANTPLNTIKAGQYQFRATLIQGDLSVQKSLFINVD